jgi:dihydroorotate dehydrogenase electron transfer subunit
MDSLTFYAVSPRHLSQILDIERKSFASPWDIQTFLSTMEDRRTAGMVAVEKGRIIGYCFAISLTNMLHILNVAIHPEFRRKGVARKLLLDVLFSEKIKGKMYAVLEVRKSNVPAMALYENLGFVHVSTWHSYYRDTNEDANVMVKDLRSQAVKDVDCMIIENREVATDTFYLLLKGKMPVSHPGQFVMVMISRSNEPFLRRPLAILSQDEENIELIYRIKGSGTNLLSRKVPGETLSLLGPLGNGFQPAEGGRNIYVSGGMGLPPVLSLAEQLKSGTFIFGVKTVQEVPLKERIQSLENTDVIFVTEDGSLGQKGLATDALSRILDQDGSAATVYACGPVGLLRSASEISERYGIDCQVSLEERMSCGFGACAGCVVKTVRGNQRVCREGPVFNAYNICWGRP